MFGDDYPTPDGSCVRDYIHVVDLAEAHVAAASALEAGRPLADVYNLGRGEGSSVLEILDAVRRALGRDLAARRRPPAAGRPGPDRRLGRPAAARDLGWRARLDLDAMVASALAAGPG